MSLKDTASFELQSYKDLYAKAQYDFARLDELVNSYDLFNFLAAINHLHEWVVKETGKKCPTVSGDTLDIIRRLCNRAKHFDHAKNSPSTEVREGYSMGRFGKGPYGVGEPSYVVTKDDGTVIHVLDLCKDALAIWDSFLKAEGLL